MWCIPCSRQWIWCFCLSQLLDSRCCRRRHPSCQDVSEGWICESVPKPFRWDQRNDRGVHSRDARGRTVKYVSSIPDDHVWFFSTRWNRLFCSRSQWRIWQRGRRWATVITIGERIVLSCYGVLVRIGLPFVVRFALPARLWYGCSHSILDRIEIVRALPMLIQIKESVQLSNDSRRLFPLSRRKVGIKSDI